MSIVWLALAACADTHGASTCRLPDAGGTDCYPAGCGWPYEPLPLSPREWFDGPVWGASIDDVWAATSTTGTAIAHRDASGWTLERFVPSTGFTTDRVQAIHGRGADDVWAVWSSGIVHRDTGGWHVADTSSVFGLDHFTAVWESPDGTALVGGSSNGVQNLLRYDGSGWTVVELRRGSPTSYETTTDIDGTRADDVWVSGADEAGPSLRHWDGHAWTDVAFRGTRMGHATCVWTGQTNDVYVGGDDGDGSQARLDHFDGERWAQVTLPAPDLGDPYGVVSPATTITDVWGTSSRDVWVGDANGNTFHFAGDRWRFLPLTSYGGAVEEAHGWSADPCHVFVSATEMFIGAP